MKKNPNIVARKVPPVVFLVDITKCYNNKTQSLLEIDDIGFAIWECIESGMNRADIAERFLNLLTDEKTDDFIAMVKADVNAFLDILIQGGCLEEDL